MKRVSNEVYSLMTKFIVNEASANERLMVESLLHENEELVTLFNELKAYYQCKEKPELKDPKPAFEKLTGRIQKMTDR